MILFNTFVLAGKRCVKQCSNKQYSLSTLLLQYNNGSCSNFPINQQHFFWFAEYATFYLIQKRTHTSTTWRMPDDNNIITSDDVIKKSCSLSTKAETNDNSVMETKDLSTGKKTKLSLASSGSIHNTHSAESLIFKEYKSAASEKNFHDALFVLGAMGSGKTTVIMEKIKTHKLYGQYAYVDTDELMARLPGFDESNVENLYPAARRIAIELTDWLLEKQLSFVAEGTCVKYQELIDYMVRLKEKGYNIKVCKIDDISLDVVLHRASTRIHRKIRPEVVKEIYIQSTLGLNEIYKINKETSIFENIDVEEL